MDAESDFPRQGTGLDRLLAFDQALCGGYYFVPALAFHGLARRRMRGSMLTGKEVEDLAISLRGLADALDGFNSYPPGAFFDADALRRMPEGDEGVLGTRDRPATGAHCAPGTRPTDKTPLMYFHWCNHRWMVRERGTSRPPVTANVDELLAQLDGRVSDELASKPDVIERDHYLDVSALPIEARKWHRLSEGAAVVAPRTEHQEPIWAGERSTTGRSVHR